MLQSPNDVFTDLFFGVSYGCNELRELCLIGLICGLDSADGGRSITVRCFGCLVCLIFWWNRIRLSHDQRLGFEARLLRF